MNKIVSDGPAYQQSFFEQINKMESFKTIVFGLQKYYEKTGKGAGFFLSVDPEKGVSVNLTLPESSQDSDYQELMAIIGKSQDLFSITGAIETVNGITPLPEEIQNLLVLTSQGVARELKG